MPEYRYTHEYRTHAGESQITFTFTSHETQDEVVDEIADSMLVYAVKNPQEWYLDDVQVEKAN